MARQPADHGIVVGSVAVFLCHAIEETGGAQTPWDTSSLASQFYFTPPVEMSEDDLAEKQMWDSVTTSRDMVQITLFLQAYPNSKYKAEARKLLAELVAEMDAELAAEPETTESTEPAQPAQPGRGPS